MTISICLKDEWFQMTHKEGDKPGDIQEVILESRVYEAKTTVMEMRKQLLETVWG